MKMEKTSILCLALLFSSTIIQGADINSTCDESSWNSFQCIQSLQQIILDLREQVKNQTNQLSTHSDQLRTYAQLSETDVNRRKKLKRTEKDGKDNSVPIGFIYVQLPDQLEPKLLWDKVVWRDITPKYAGLFFRALGGGSEEFNVTQTEDIPRISVIEKDFKEDQREKINLPPSGWSKLVSSGLKAGVFDYFHWGLRFFTTKAEVRPRNTAVRIWKRIK